MPDASFMNCTLHNTLLKSVLMEIHNWLMHHLPKTATGSTLTKAMDYLLRRWEAYTCYADTGHLPIDNNPVENAIRSIALGKKNCLFTGTERSGQRTTAIHNRHWLCKWLGWTLTYV
ncbi:MAG: transposase [Thiotrichales bacterium]|nr:transposase [Thiotrichales bacterium]